MSKKFFTAILLLAATSANAQHNNAVQDTLTGKDLDEVVVTATKTPLKQSQTGKVVSVIDQATLKRNAGKTLTEILNMQSGIFINGANNPLGTNQDIYFRGAATGNVLILVDGIAVSDASQIDNRFDLNGIAPSQIERIEILKGAQSTLWGSNAVAGVINIITKKGGTKAISPNVMLSYGSYNTLRGSVGVNGQVKGLTYNVSYNRTDSKGFSAAYDSSGKADFDKDKFVQDNLQANVGYKFSSAFSANALAQMGQYKTDLDADAFTDEKDYTSKSRNRLYALDLAFTQKALTLHLVNSLQQSKRELTDDSTYIVPNGYYDYAHQEYNATTNISELYGNYKISPKAAVVAGVQGLWQKNDQYYMSTSAFGPYETKLGDTAKIHNTSAYASFVLTNISGFNAEAGVRYNSHSIYGSNVTYTFNPSYNIDENTRVFVNVSSAFRMPSLYQLYSEYGNKNLKPEKSMNYEMGVQSFSNNHKNSFRILGFKRDIKDVFAFKYDPQTFSSQYINRDQQNDYGFEMESNIGIGKIGNWVSNLTYVDGDGINDGNKAKNLYRRPNFTFNSTLNVQPAKGFTLSPSFRFVGTRQRSPYDFGPDPMESYYTIDVYAAYTYGGKYRVFADFRNLTNQQYFDVPGYNSRRFNLMAGVSLDF